jgi:glycosyltransferase involved in cell wall biosynthesis
MTDTLLCFLDHPTQYDPPLWRALHRRGVLRPCVHYLRPTAPTDPEIQRAVGWSHHGDGFESRTVRLEEIRSIVFNAQPRPLAVLTAGWKQPSAVRATLAARIAGIPVIQPSDKTLNERSPKGPSRLALTTFHAVRVRAADAFFTTGLLGTQALRSLGVPHERIATGLYPIEVQHWQSRGQDLGVASARLRPQAPDAFVVLAVSKWSERENPLDIIEAFALLRSQFPKAFLIYVGDGPMRKEVAARIVELGLGSAVSLPGYVSYDQLPSYYYAADVFVHAPKLEPWGISVLEAMACSVPVVATTTVGAAADLVIPGSTGELAYPSSSESLARALLRVARTEKGRNMGQKALERVKRFDTSTVAERLETLVHHLHPREAHDPLTRVVISDLRNVWGRWPA